MEELHVVVVGLLVWALRIVLGLEFSLFKWVCWTKQNRGGRAEELCIARATNHQYIALRNPRCRPNNYSNL